MPLTVLTDSNVQEILDKLSRDETVVMQKALADALHDYATAAGSESAQPNRTVVEAPDGTTTLFMPSTNPSCIGMKGISFSPTLHTPAHQPLQWSPFPAQSKSQNPPPKSKSQKAQKPHLKALSL